MTIGIAVAGPGAGLAAVGALRAVEQVARGAIGGFVSLVAIGAGGELLRAQTQRGGTRTLFTAGEATGVDAPDAIARAPLVALMSSGPDRPEPLAQFTPGDASVGLVTGHRLPNMPGVDGVALNVAVLRRLAAGGAPREAIELELQRNPNADAGLIAVNLDGAMHLADSAFVARRPDLGRALVTEPETGATIAILHNAIHPHASLAQLAASVALDCIAPLDRSDFTTELCAGQKLELAAENCIHLDGDNVIERVTVTEQRWLGARHDGAAVNFAAAVRRNGVVVGTTTSEPYCIAENGRLRSVSGQDRAPVTVRFLRA